MGKEKDEFGNRMKMYEKLGSRKLMPYLPIVARLDGRSFHRFTKGLKMPYDELFRRVMIETTKFLVEETNANIGYTQSDEISLSWYRPDYRKEIIFFGARVEKLTSILASLCTGKFLMLLKEYLPNKVSNEAIPVFDCRIWTVPNLREAVNAFLWREQDAVKNSISMAVRTYYTHKECDKKNSSEKQDMLWKKGINWNDYPAYFKRGQYIQIKAFRQKFTAEELKNLPPKHDAHKNPEMEFTRRRIVELQIPPLSKIQNSIEVLYEEANPIVEGGGLSRD